MLKTELKDVFQPEFLGPIQQAMTTYTHSDATGDRLRWHRFHVPGHGGRPLFSSLGLPLSTSQPLYQVDLTELDGLDVLSEPEGCIAESQALVAEAFGVAHSFYLLNGSTVGLQAAILAAFQPGDTVLVARNAHRSVLSGLILGGLTPAWFWPVVYPEFGLWGEVTPAILEAALEQHPTAKGVVVTSPTYEGIASSVGDLALFCHSHGLTLIVDEAHGSLFPFSEALPLSACHSEADVVIQSLHKSAGSLTQTALAHLPVGSRLSSSRFQQALNTLQTTSPSYPLLANAEACVQFLSSADGQQLLQEQIQAVSAFNHHCLESLASFTRFQSNTAVTDSLVLFLKNHYKAGEDWGCQLEADYHVAFESVQTFGTLYKWGLGTTPDNHQALAAALKAMDQSIIEEHCALYDFPNQSAHYLPLTPQQALSPREAFFRPGTPVKKRAAVGRIAQETIVHCPPGIPVLYPGEVITEAVLPYLPETVSVIP